MGDSIIGRCAFLGALCCAIAGVHFVSKKRSHPLPPGPPAGSMLLGHYGQMPWGSPVTVFREWAKKYGDVVYLRCFGQPYIVLDSAEAATELLEKQSAIFSSRPNTMVYKLMGWDPDVVFLPYGPHFRKQRKIFQTSFSPQACVEFQPMQLQNARILVHGLMENQGDSVQLLNRFTIALAIGIAYGHQILSADDEYIKVIQDSSTALSYGGMPAGTLVDYFPVLQYFPSWFPGTHYVNVAREWKWAVRKMIEWPYEVVLKNIAEGSARPCFVVNQLEAACKDVLTSDEHEDIRTAAAVIYSAGSDTTSFTLQKFFLAMLLYPEVQKKGQDEVDQVVGADRLPSFEDRDSLPFVYCIIQELLRWHPVAPLAVPHCSTEECVYKGMRIPKGSYVFPNTESMSLDDNVYTNPSEFNPSRFLPPSEGGKGEPQFEPAFGFGRRVCPGKHLALANIWAVVSTVLATLQIGKSSDETGREITPSGKFNIGFTSCPKEFCCSVVGRPNRARDLVRELVVKVSS
ncbi:cytochrome P450 [Pleurotus eryngii]|uniref:Cytochrome P450 n=1 Tax=Pleurotus eryngii TaxID=5323 RepID=A0A9P6D0U7_PLEER|nr:cytochrome P450 [Pleurotus eryngii]